MSVSATHLYINAVGLTFTPAGGSASPLNRVTKVSLDGGIENVTFKGDGDMFNTFEGNVNQTPSVSVESGAVGALMAGGAGVVGSLAFTQPDARNGTTAGGFGIAYTLSNAILSDKNMSAPHAQIASGMNSFSSFSSDGTTNPLAFTIL